MAVVTTRYALRANDDPEAIPEIVSVKTVVTADEDGRRDMPIPVQAEAAQLLVSVGPADEGRPSNPLNATVDMTLVGPDERPITPLARLGNYGSVIFVVENPRPGRWRAMFRYAAKSSFVVRAVSMTKHAREALERALPRVKCTGCREGLEAAIAAAVVYLGGLVMGAAVPVVPAAAVAQVFSLPEKLIDYLLTRVKDASMETLIQEACVFMRLCPEE
jgi:hypothetical protein